MNTRTKLIATAAALAAAVVPTTASAATTTFNGNCRFGGIAFYGPTFDAPTTSHVAGVGDCIGSLNGGPKLQYDGVSFQVDRVGLMLPVSDVKRPTVPQVLEVLAAGTGALQFNGVQTTPTIGFRSTQSLVAQLVTGNLGGGGVGIVTTDALGDVQIAYGFTALKG